VGLLFTVYSSGDFVGVAVWLRLRPGIGEATLVMCSAAAKRAESAVDGVYADGPEWF
jgi:hypothetical protein